MNRPLAIAIAVALAGIILMSSTQAVYFVIHPKYPAAKETVPEKLIDNPTQPMKFTNALEQTCHCDLRVAKRYEELYSPKSCDNSCHESKPPKCPRWCTYYKQATIAVPEPPKARSRASMVKITPTTTSSAQKAVSPQKPQSSPVTASAPQIKGCDALPDKLDKCEPFKCTFTHPLTGEPMTKEIRGVSGNKCVYVEQMPNGGKMECNYLESMRKSVAQFLKSTASATSVETKFQSDLLTSQSKTIVNGKEVPNPLQEATDTGQCVVSGY